MKNLTTKTISAFSVAAALTIASMSGGCVISGDDDSSLTIANESSFVFVDLAVRGLSDRDFSENLLRGGPLFPGEDITVFLDCDDYDVFIEDDAGGQCTIAVDLCFDDALWVVDDFELDSCIFGAAPRIQKDGVEKSKRQVDMTTEAVEAVAAEAVTADSIDL